MPALSAVALLGLLASAPPDACDPEVDRALAGLDDAMRQLERELDDVDAKASRKRLRRDLEDALAAVALVREKTCPAVPPPAPPPPPPPPLAVLGNDDVRALSASMQAQAFEEARMKMLVSGSNGRCLTSEAAAKLLLLFTFEGARIEAARLLVPRLVDRQRGHLLLATFDFESGKTAVAEMLKTQPREARCPTRP